MSSIYNFLRPLSTHYRIWIAVIACMAMCLSTLMGQGYKVKTDLDKKTLKEYNKGIELSRKGKKEKSLKSFQKVVSKYPDFVDGHLRLAGMYHNLGKIEDAINTFQKAIAIAPDYEPEAYYSLAMIYKNQEQYGEATTYYDEFISRSKDTKKVTKAQELRTQVAFAHHAINNPVDFDPQKLSGGINTQYSEYMPAMTIEGDRIIFTRRIDDQEDFYIAEYKDGVAGRVVEIEALNTHQNEGIHCLSADGKYLIFTACDRRVTGMGSCDLYYSRLDSDQWTIPNNMGPVINTIFWDAQPSLSSDGKTLFFSSNRKYGLGGNDIWMSTRTDTSGWTDPVVLPKEINTSANEESPFIHPDGHTLYFRSNGHVGMGDYDIFYSRYIDSTKSWSQAVNIGYPINTKGSEGAFSVSLDGTTAFFASDMDYADDKKNANLDIYKFTLYDEARPAPTTFVKAKIIDHETNNPLIAYYTIENLSNRAVAPVTGKSNNAGTFLNSLLSDHDYAFFVEKEGYAMYSQSIKLEGIRSSIDPIILEVRLVKIKELPEEVDVAKETDAPVPVILNNIFFEFGSSDLLSESMVEIDRLVKNLNDNPGSKILIIGHTDDIGSEKDNLILSQQRAKEVAESIISKGVARARVSFEGYGETRPIANNSTEEGRKMNRRTEFILRY